MIAMRLSVFMPFFMPNSNALAGSATQNAVAPISLRYSADVPESQKKLIELDLSRITQSNFSLNDSKMMSLFDQTTPVTPEHLLGWLVERVRILIPGTYEYSLTNLNFEKTGFQYPKPDLFPKDNRDAAVVSANNAREALSNLGAMAYSDSKAAAQGLRSLTLPGLGVVVLSSPRVGLIEAGAALFAATTLGPLNSIENSFLRLSYLFHEGRHSDGNGFSQGFFHVICPKGSVYAGLAACDSSLNGAYTIGAQVLRAYTESCLTCSVKTKEQLRAIYLDSFARVLKQLPFANVHTADELAIMVAGCDRMKAHDWKESSDCPLWRAEQAQQLAHLPAWRPTLAWDDAPEGEIQN